MALVNALGALALDATVAAVRGAVDGVRDVVTAQRPVLEAIRDRAAYPLPAEQVGALTPPTPPAAYPLPTAQFVELVQPDSYALPDAQLATLAREATLATRATEATLGTRSSETTLAAARDALLTLRDTVARRTDTLTITTGPAVAATSQDRLFLTSTGRLALAGGLSGGGTMRIVVTNTSPAIPMLLLRLAGFSTAVGWLQMVRQPDTNLPTAAPRPVLNARTNSTATSPLEVRVDTNTTSLGGVDTGLVVGIPPNSRMNIDLPPLRLDPGQRLGFSVPFPGEASASMSLVWMHAA